MKYIIEIPDDVQYVLFNGKANNKYYTAVHPIAELEVLNSDYINEHYGELQDEAYQAGLKDGYGTAKSLVWETSANEYTSLGINIYDWGEDESEVLRHYSAQEAVDLLHKIREHKDSDRIEVGDEVTHKSDLAVWKAVCIRIDGDRQHMNLMGHTGAVGYYPVDDFKKTGKHYDIQSILEAMRK